MRVLLDTSVIVAALSKINPAYDRALGWLQRVNRGEITAVISSHTLAEVYAVLTGLPARPKIAPRDAWRLIEENLLTKMEVIPLTIDDYKTVLQYLAQMNIAGGITYDALIIHAARKAVVEQVVTLNEKHFRRVNPDPSLPITAP